MSKNDFDSLFDRLDALTVGFGPMFRDFHFETAGYPPHNIQKLSTDKFVIELAVAGFKKSQIEVRELSGEVTVQGIKGDPQSDDAVNAYQYRGISNRNFIKRFKIAEYYKVDKVAMEDGLLSITFVKNEPEAAKPKIFTIN